MVLRKILKVQSIADVCLLPNSSSGHCSHFLTIYVFRSKLSDKEPEGEKLNASCSENIHEHMGRPEGHDKSCKLKKVTTHFHCFIFSNHPPTRVSRFSIFLGKIYDGLPLILKSFRGTSFFAHARSDDMPDSSSPTHRSRATVVENGSLSGWLDGLFPFKRRIWILVPTSSQPCVLIH